MKWWQTGVVYQIYPRSFADANGDGIGDLAGITARLEYLQWLGVEAIWLSPCYPSPMKDFGYDVSDYVDIHPDFGTLADFDKLLEEAKALGIRVLLDFVPNHTSDQHDWFKESRSSRNNPKRDWYVWRDAKPDGSLPNNWKSMFGGPAWTFDETTGQYYLHSFLKEQPDLNWRNPDVLAAMLDVLRFWMRRGVAGFRIDVVDFIMKHPEFADNPRNPSYQAGVHNPWEEYLNVNAFGHADVHQVMHAINRTLNEFPDAVAIGEVNYLIPLETVASYYGVEDAREMDIPFNWRLMQMAQRGWRAADVRAFVDQYDAAIPQYAWGNWVLGNHDTTRVGTRLGREGVRLAALLQLTLRGTPFIYYGEEIGMIDVPIAPDQQQDPFGIRVPGMGRDPERTPMQWDDSPRAGFSPAYGQDPWLPLSPDYKTWNVAAEQKDPRSILNLYQRVMHLRRETPALNRGTYRSIETGNPDCFAYLREYDGEQRLIALNFSAEPIVVNLSAAGTAGRILLSTELDREDDLLLAAVNLRPHEGILLSL
jgi:alpha-glucosidase